MLYIVSTPIGNLKDITLRALETLKEVDLVAAEDTRHTGQLLKHFDIQKPLTSFYAHNENVKSEYIVGLLKEGKKIALVSDAGTPGIADPGFALIRAVKEAGIPVTVIPGACALIAGLTLSGLPTHEFLFIGFLPVKSGARRKAIEAIPSKNCTVVMYESPHRVLKALEDMKEVLNDPLVSIARELTKTFEECVERRASEHLTHFAKHPPKGEFVLLINPK